MAVVDANARLKALDRQKLLYNLHCKNCENYNERNSLKWCPGCAIWDEFLEIGEVLDNTISERKKCLMKN